MKRLALLAAACCLGLARPVPADDSSFLLFDGSHWRFPKLCAEWHQRCCCPDDYCSKPLPCVEPNPRGCCDDYCRKPLPCVPPTPKGCCDDYCPKCCPIFLRKPCESWYTCGPPELCCPCPKP